jgi:hypothetical protein
MEISGANVPGFGLPMLRKTMLWAATGVLLGLAAHAGPIAWYRWLVDRGPTDGQLKPAAGAAFIKIELHIDGAVQLVENRDGTVINVAGKWYCR